MTFKQKEITGDEESLLIDQEFDSSGRSDNLKSKCILMASEYLKAKAAGGPEQRQEQTHSHAGSL